MAGSCSLALCLSLLPLALACQLNYFRASSSHSLEPKPPAASGCISSQYDHQKVPVIRERFWVAMCPCSHVVRGNHLAGEDGSIEPSSIRSSVPRSKRAECWAGKPPRYRHLLSKHALNTYCVSTLCATLKTQRWPRCSWCLPSWSWCFNKTDSNE